MLADPADEAEAPRVGQVEVAHVAAERERAVGAAAAVDRDEGGRAVLLLAPADLAVAVEQVEARGVEERAQPPRHLRRRLPAVHLARRLRARVRAAGGEQLVRQLERRLDDRVGAAARRAAGLGRERREGEPLEHVVADEGVGAPVAVHRVLREQREHLERLERALGQVPAEEGALARRALRLARLKIGDLGREQRRQPLLAGAAAARARRRDRRDHLRRRAPAQRAQLLQRQVLERGVVLRRGPRLVARRRPADGEHLIGGVVEEDLADAHADRGLDLEDALRADVDALHLARAQDPRLPPQRRQLLGGGRRRRDDQRRGRRASGASRGRGRGQAKCGLRDRLAQLLARPADPRLDRALGGRVLDDHRLEHRARLLGDEGAHVGLDGGARLGLLLEEHRGRGRERGARLCVVGPTEGRARNRRAAEIASRSRKSAAGGWP